MRIQNLGGFQAIQKNVTTSGTPVKLSGYYANTTIAFNDNGASADTITDSASNFLNMGFAPGDKLVITGSTSNNFTVEIDTVVAGTITLVTSTSTNPANLVTEAAGDAVVLDTLHGVKVEDGVGVVLKAKAANTGVITVGSTSAKALNTNTEYFSNWRLSAGQSITLQVKNLNSIWLDATVSGEGIEVLMEV